YSLDQFDTHQKVTLNVENKEVTEILNLLFIKKGVKYKISGKNIVLYLANDGPTVKNTTKSQPLKKITGTVTDSNGQVIIGASIGVKGGSGQGTATDVNGSFQLEVVEGATLTVSSVGYVSKVVIVGASSVLKIVLEEESQSLDEVI